MLVLERKIGQSLYLGEGIRVVFIQGGPHSFKIGIEAERTVSIVRGEFYEQIQHANLRAAWVTLSTFEWVKEVLNDRDESTKTRFRRGIIAAKK